MCKDFSAADVLASLHALRLSGAADAYEAQLTEEHKYANMPFAERLQILLSQELCNRTDKRTDRLKKHAGLKFPMACFEDIIERPERQLDLRTLSSLKTNDYLNQAHNIIIVGAAGTGKTFISNALGTQACRAGYTVRYFSQSAFLNHIREIQQMTDPDKALRLRKDLDKTDLVILDEFLLTEVSKEEIVIFYEFFASRHGRHSTILCSQYTCDAWHSRLGGELLADSIMDRILPSSYRLPIESTVSMREFYENHSLPVPGQISDIH